MDDAANSLKEQIKEAESPKSEMIEYMASAQKMIYENGIKEYQENLEKWKKEYPESPNVLIKNRLQMLLDETEGIDYNAALQEKSGRKYFANAAYERKPGYWKLGFRAGKDVTESTRAFAKQWLAELK